MKLLLIRIVFLLISFSCLSQEDKSIVSHLDSAFASGVELGRFPGLSCAFINHDTTWIGSYGVSEWNAESKIDPTIKFQLGSVGKVLTAIAVLQQVDAGNLDLDIDVTAYIDFDLQRKSDFNDLTLRDLLTHAAGMNDRNIGYLSKDSSSLQSLGEHLVRNLPEFYQDVGIDISYSNYSYALAGYIVEKVSGLPFDRYIKERIFDPLGMDDSMVGFQFDYQNDQSYANGHTKGKNGEFLYTQEYARHALPAGSFISTSSDISKLLNASINKSPLILLANSWSLLFRRQFSNHELLTGYSLGLEEQRVGDQTYWAKGGMLMGYYSQLVFLPDGSGLFIAINTNDDTFLEEFYPFFFKKFFGTVDANSSPLVQTDFSKYAGEYRNSRFDREGVENIISLFKGVFEIWESEKGLLAFHNGEMHNYSHIGNHVFVNEINPNEKMIFIIDESGKVEKLYRNINIGGLAIPSTFEKTKWYNSPTFVNEYYGFVLLVILGYSLIIIGACIVSLIRIKKRGFWKWDILNPINYLIALLGILSVILHIFSAIVPLIKNTNEFLFGTPENFRIANHLALVVALFALISFVSFIYILWRREGSIFSRIAYGLYSVALGMHALGLFYWNFI
ncbi:serine hydrolase domain-containing protein [Ekhidna sp.]